MEVVCDEELLNMEKLFSYGTLQYEAVQLDTFGRKLDGKKDKLFKHKIERVKIHDKSVVDSSGTDNHPIIRYTGKREDFVEGVLFEISYDELLLADKYEVDEYTRKKVIFESGSDGWVYAGT